MSAELYFSLEPTLRLAEHAVAAAEHEQTFDEILQDQPCPGALEFVCDSGIYLMSSGVPGLPPAPDNPDDPEATDLGDAVVYAEGWGPASPWRRDLAHALPGHDNTVEHLHLTTIKRPKDVPLIEYLRGGAQLSLRYLVLYVAYTDITFNITNHPPISR